MVDSIAYIKKNDNKLYKIRIYLDAEFKSTAVSCDELNVSSVSTFCMNVLLNMQYRYVETIVEAKDRNNAYEIASHKIARYFTSVGDELYRAIDDCIEKEHTYKISYCIKNSAWGCKTTDPVFALEDKVLFDEPGTSFIYYTRALSKEQAIAKTKEALTKRIQE